MRGCLVAYLVIPTLAAGQARAQPPQPFAHIVIIIQENRTVDNLFGSNPSFEPGIDIATTGTNSQGQIIPLTAEPLVSCYDIGHSHAAFVDIYARGGMNGADREPVKPKRGCVLPPNPQFKFVDNSSGAVQPYFDIAAQYGFANRMFQTNQGPSFPAHQFLFGGTSAPTADSSLFAAENMSLKGGAGCVAPPKQRVALINAQGSETAQPPVYPCFEHATMADLLDGAGLGWQYYVNGLRDASIWAAPAAIKHLCGEQKHGNKRLCDGQGYIDHVQSGQAQVLTDIANCALTSVSWIIPDAAESDHAGIDKGLGPSWVSSIVNAVGNQPPCPSGETYWSDTAIFITWDDWGGWYDHVRPFHTGGWGGAANWGAGYTYGLRLPLMVVSAYTPAGYVDNSDNDFGSILRFVETNFGMGTIGPGYYADAYGGDLSPFFSLGAPRPFQTIQAPKGAAYFLHAKPSLVPPDDD